MVGMVKKTEADASERQRARFIETARELGADQDADALDRVFGKVAPPVVPKPAEKGDKDA